MPENIQEANNPNNLLARESEHIPRFVEQDNKVYIRLGEGDEDIDFPATDEHHISSVGLFDEYGDVIEWRKVDTEDPQVWYVFEKPDTEYEVRAACNLHGSWKGILEEDLFLRLPKNFEEKNVTKELFSM